MAGILCQYHFQHANDACLRVMPANIQIPELRTVATFGRGHLIGRPRVLSQALLDQFHQWFAQSQGMLVRLNQRGVLPVHRNQLGRSAAIELVALSTASA